MYYTVLCMHLYVFIYIHTSGFFFFEPQFLFFYNINYYIDQWLASQRVCRKFMTGLWGTMYMNENHAVFYIILSMMNMSRDSIAYSII